MARPFFFSFAAAAAAETARRKRGLFFDFDEDLVGEISRRIGRRLVVIRSRPRLRRYCISISR